MEQKGVYTRTVFIRKHLVACYDVLNYMYTEVQMAIYKTKFSKPNVFWFLIGHCGLTLNAYCYLTLCA